MTEEELIGAWSFNAGYETDLSNDKQLVFEKNGAGKVMGGKELVVNFEWAIEKNNEDILIGNLTTPDGELVSKPNLSETGAKFNNEQLPNGNFLVVEFSKFSLPFGLRKFVKLTT